MKHQSITPGFYYHYKHNPSLDICNYAYEVVGFGLHTEIENRDEAQMVIYRPLYETAHVYQIGKLYDIRPLAMFSEEVVVSGITQYRFQRITDQSIINQLEIIKQSMYA